MKINPSSFKLPALLLSLMLLYSCKKNNNKTPVTETPAPSPVTNRVVKYEIRGTYTGQLLVDIFDNVNGNSLDTVLSLPWSKEINYSSTVTGIGIGANSVVKYPGQPAQTVTVSIMVSGSTVKSQTAVSGMNGYVNMQSLAYVF